MQLLIGNYTNCVWTMRLEMSMLTFLRFKDGVELVYGIYRKYFDRRCYLDHIEITIANVSVIKNAATIFVFFCLRCVYFVLYQVQQLTKRC